MLYRCPPPVSVQACYGPLARDVDTLALTMQVLCGPAAQLSDPTVPPVPFNSEVSDWLVWRPF